MVITIDTNILLWGLRGVSKAGQEDMVVRAKAFFQYLHDRGAVIVLASECVAEYLVGEEEPVRREQQMADLKEQFVIIPYDIKAAGIAAQIRSDKTFLQSLKGDIGATRTCIKSDTVIAATAKAFRKNGVDELYSNDDTLRKIATKCGLSAKDLPSLDDMATRTNPIAIAKKAGILPFDEIGAEGIEPPTSGL